MMQGKDMRVSRETFFATPKDVHAHIELLVARHPYIV